MGTCSSTDVPFDAGGARALSSNEKRVVGVYHAIERAGINSYLQVTLGADGMYEMQRWDTVSPPVAVASAADAGVGMTMIGRNPVTRARNGTLRSWRGYWKAVLTS